MSQDTLAFMLNLLFWLGGILTLYSLYFIALALFSFKRQMAAPEANAKTRFALLVAARNEAAVIGQLVDSLHAQNYPKELYDIFVAPNNCTDDTREVALAHGAQIFDPEGTISSKGEVLAQVGARLMEMDSYDALCVFDADNLVHPNFLQKMNDAYVAGARAAQGFRDSKNPEDTAVSTCYSVVYWMLSRFYNAGRSALRLSALINGSGFMVSVALLRKLGGWRTHTMTEDYEFTAQCALAGERVHYVPGAVIYDEQPLTFFQSWRQRRRWTTGSVQGMTIYAGALVRAAIGARSPVCADLALTFITPAVQLVSVVLGIATMILGGYQVFKFDLIPPVWAMLVIIGVLLLAIALCSLAAAVMVALNRAGNMRGTGKGIACFALFVASQLPIALLSLVKPKRKWDAIAHTRAVSIGEVTTRR